MNLFDISWDDQATQALEETINTYAAMNLQDRWRNDIRLDFVLPSFFNNSDIYYLDFSKKRDIGPGKLSSIEEVSPINLGNGYSFGEETSALYIPSKRVLLILYNHYGVGPSRMMEYFNIVNPTDDKSFLSYYSMPRLSPIAYKQFKSMKSFDKVQVTATIEALAEDQHSAGVSFARASRSLGGRRINFEINANEAYQKGDYLRKGPVKSFIEKLRGKDEDQVSSLKVKGKVGGRDKLIDLIDQKITQKFSDRDLTVLHNKYTIQSKRDLLTRSLRGWAGLIKL